MKVVSIIGVRPQFVKHKLVSDALRKRGHQDIIIHTGQHYDYEMDQVFFNKLRIPKPEYNLNLKDKDMGESVKTVAHYIWVDNPDVVIVYGDARATYIGAQAAIKVGKPLAHIEAGLRCGNPNMKEEIYRRLTDHVSDYLFAPTESAAQNLIFEDCIGHIHVSGDVMRECLFNFLPVAPKYDSDDYVLLTLHRAELVDHKFDLKRALKQVYVEASKRNVGVIWPIHPRTKKMIEEYNVNTYFFDLIDPVDYLTMIRLESKASLIMTDSGGVQREGYWLNKPVILMRNETEWTEIDDGKIESPVNYIIDVLEGER